MIRVCIWAVIEFKPSSSSRCGIIFFVEGRLSELLILIGLWECDFMDLFYVQWRKNVFHNSFFLNVSSRVNVHQINKRIVPQGMFIDTTVCHKMKKPSKLNIYNSLVFDCFYFYTINIESCFKRWIQYYSDVH